MSRLYRGQTKEELALLYRALNTERNLVWGLHKNSHYTDDVFLKQHTTISRMLDDIEEEYNQRYKEKDNG